MKRVITLWAIILLTACGGGGSGAGPSSIVGVTLVGADPPPGSTVTLVADAYLGVAPLSMTFSVVSDKDIPLPYPGVEWVAGDGRSCGVDNDAGGWSHDTLKANEPRTLTVHGVAFTGTGPAGSFVPDCPLPTTTSVVRVTVVEFCLVCTGNEPSFVRELPISYTFLPPVH